MNAADRSELVQVLQKRCDIIADSWYQAIEQTSRVPHSSRVRQHLVGLTEQAIALLLTDALEQGPAEAIGASLARLQHIEPEGLGRTQELLAQQLVEGLPAGQVAALQPRLATLLGGLVAGFFRQARETILTEQEQVQRAVISDPQREAVARGRMEEELLHPREETLRNHHLLLALSQAAQAVQRARTPKEVYRTIGDEVTELGYHAMVFTLADGHEHVTLSHTTFEPAWLRTVEDLFGLPVHGFCFPLAPDGLFQRVIDEGKSAFCERTAELAARTIPELGRPLIERLVAMLGIEKSIYTPLRVSGETHGLLGVASTDLTAADVPAITIFANQAGIAIENAQLLEQLGTSRERLRRLAQQIVSAQEEERQRLSRALHDEAGQALTALKISLELIQQDLPVEFGSLRRRIGDAAALTDATMEQIRLLARNLRPPALDTVGLGPTLEGFCRDFAQRTRLSIDYLGLELPMLPEAASICLYRFLQEALTNVAKHARAHQVHVALHRDAETVSLSVEDDGRGFDRQARLSVSGWPMGIGLLGMQERLESLGGRLKIDSQPGQGTRLVAFLPAGGVL